jgi:2-desacetyl-2-hydroxyethyl bacteriochlorophyllide A dehydrogenase
MPRAKVCIKEKEGAVALTTADLADPGPGQALIRTTLTTICGSDIHIVDEIPLVPAGTPMGHEAVGIVEAVGADVGRFRPGDRVVSSCLLSCGECARCRFGEPQICSTFGAPMNLLFGAQSEAFLVPAADQSLAKIPPGVTDRQAVCAADVLSTGFAAVERASVREGQSVAVFAQGPVGLCATLAAKFYGAEPLVVVEGLPARAAMARRFGADTVLDPATAADEIMRLTAGAGVDVAIEALGKQETFEACCRVVRLGGVVSSVGVYGGLEALRLPLDGSFIHRTLVTTLCPVGSGRLEYLLRLLERGEIDPSPLFTHESALADIVQAYDLFRSRRDGVIKVAIF